MAQVALTARIRDMNTTKTKKNANTARRLVTAAAALIARQKNIDTASAQISAGGAAGLDLVTAVHTVLQGCMRHKIVMQCAFCSG